MTNPQSALATIQAQVSALAAPDATMQQIEAQMAGLWNDAEARGDENAIAYLQAAWNHTTMLAQSTSAANAVATAALQAAVEIAEEHADLIQAIDNMDADNAHVAELIQAVEESTYEWLTYNEDYEGIHDAQPGITAEENGHLGDTPADDIDAFLHIVLGDSEQLPDEMNAELVEFINMFIPAAREYWHGEAKKRRAESERRAAEFAAKRAAEQAAKQQAS